MIIPTSPPPEAVDVATYLARYLRLLPNDTQRVSMLKLLRELEPAAASELIGYLRQLDASAAADPRFLETYLFAPRQWSDRILAGSARRWAHPALRHLAPDHSVSPPGKATATPFFREPNGISDMWALVIPKGTAVTLDTMGSKLAIAPIGDAGVAIGAQQVGRGSPTIVPQQHTVSVKPAEDSGRGSLVLVVASPALLDTAPTGQWLTSSGIDVSKEPLTATAAKPPPKYPSGPRSGAAGHRHWPVPNPGDPLPPTATSRGQSPLR